VFGTRKARLSLTHGPSDRRRPDPAERQKGKRQCLATCYARDNSLIGVSGGARPNLERVEVGQIAIREIKALALVGQRDAVVVSVEPVLLRQVDETLPDLHLDPVGWVLLGRVETKVCAGENELGLAPHDVPILGRAVVAVENLQRGDFQLASPPAHDIDSPAQAAHSDVYCLGGLRICSRSRLGECYRTPRDRRRLA
jgi:hypothetical protein